jgi:hypothetical protein
VCDSGRGCKRIHHRGYTVVAPQWNRQPKTNQKEFYWCSSGSPHSAYCSISTDMEIIALTSRLKDHDQISAEAMILK